MTDNALEQRIHSLYAVPVPAALDDRIQAAVASSPTRSVGRRRPRLLAGLAIAATFVVMAAGPAMQWFEGWSRPFDQLWEAATPVDQSVTVDRYKVTAHRAYADRLGVRVALTVRDLDARWSAIEIDKAEAIDAQGRVFPGWAWSGSRTPVDGALATWARFVVPADFDPDDGPLRIAVTSLLVRAPEASGVDPEQLWTTVSGDWAFEIDMPSMTAGESVVPMASATEQGVSVAMEELGVVPSGTVVRISVDGLPAAQAGDLFGWLPSSRIEHNGKPLTDQPFEPGIVSGDGVITIEGNPDVDDLVGHWRITIDSFYASDDAGSQSIDGPWVLEFDVPSSS